MEEVNLSNDNGDTRGNPATELGEDSGSDLDEDIETLARRPAKKHSPNPLPAPPAEVDLSDDDGDSDQLTTNSQNQKYSFRRRRGVNYADLATLSDDDEQEAKNKKTKSPKKSKTLDLFTLIGTQLNKFLKKPPLLEEMPNWSINLYALPLKKTAVRINADNDGDNDDLPQDRLEALSKFVEKCGQYCDTVFLSVPPDVGKRELGILTNFFDNSELLTKVICKYDFNDKDSSKENILEPILKRIGKSVWKGRLKSLGSLKLTSLRGNGVLRNSDLKCILDCKLKLQNLELGDALWEDVSTLEELLEQNKNTMESLIIHGGFKGDADVQKIQLNIPRMERLKDLRICPVYSFVSPGVNPASKKSRLVKLDSDTGGKALRVGLKLSGDYPQLRKVILGNLVELEEFGFSLLRKLDVFRCGCYWNLAVGFPPSGSRQAEKRSMITSLQLPDGLKDPLFIPKVAEFFPNLKRVWLALPSVPVLRAFFKAFENSRVEALYLKTQFDFDSTMESCLLPEPNFQEELSPQSKSILETLKSYKYFEDYVRYHNIQLPISEDSLLSSHSAGIRALKSLKVLELQHLGRELLIPNPEDERKWYDHNFKYLSTTFGFKFYPFSRKCHEEILKMQLDSYTWGSLQISSKVTQDFDRAGYISVGGGELTSIFLGDVVGDSSSDEDLFVPIKRSRGVAVTIKPNMLLPNDFKNKGEH